MKPGGNTHLRHLRFVRRGVPRDQAGADGTLSRNVRTCVSLVRWGVIMSTSPDSNRVLPRGNKVFPFRVMDTTSVSRGRPASSSVCPTRGEDVESRASNNDVSCGSVAARRTLVRASPCTSEGLPHRHPSGEPPVVHDGGPAHAGVDEAPEGCIQGIVGGQRDRCLGHQGPGRDGGILRSHQLLHPGLRDDADDRAIALRDDGPGLAGLLSDVTYRASGSSTGPAGVMASRTSARMVAMARAKLLRGAPQATASARASRRYRTARARSTRFSTRWHSRATRVLC